ncbi:MAG: Lrp/AsnC family transcriptional regulator, partial [Halobacteriaceae archaeon]
MQALDDTDLEILAALAADGRRPYSDIGEAVGLSGPAVSDRVNRLQAAGVINRFTIDVDRSQLRAGIPVFVRVDTAGGDVEALRETVADAEPVEHVFVTADGDVMFYARAAGVDVRTWLEDLLDGADYTVTLVDDYEW